MTDRERFFGAYDPSRLLGGSGSHHHHRGLVDPFSHIASNAMKPRMRICFDPETELPKLQKWFKENNHPTRQQVSENKGQSYRTFFRCKRTKLRVSYQAWSFLSKYIFST